MERGILGVKSDPKKKIIFFFNGESWPSDDSEDESYNPEESDAVTSSDLMTREIIPSTTKKKKKRKRDDDDGNPSRQSKKHKRSALPEDVASGSSSEKIKKKKRSKKSHPENPEIIEEYFEPGPWGISLPEPILVEIFKFVLRSDGAIHFLENTANVCALWNRVSYHPLLWEVVDLGDRKMKNEQEFIDLLHSRLSHMKELNLSNWDDKITFRGIRAVIEHCPYLTNLNLSGCKKVTATDVRLVADSCLNLTSIDLSQTAYRSHSNESPVSINSLKYLFQKCGEKIVSLAIANNGIPSLSNLINAICEYCNKLKMLDMSNVESRGSDCVAFNIEKLQASCPELQVLRLANTRFRLANVPLSVQASSLGFPHLRELSVAAQVTGYNSSLDDAGLSRIVKSSEKLQLLDVRGCKRVSTSGLVKIPAWHLRHLFLAQCSATMDPELELLMQKWRHSLIEVDLSGNNHINKSVDIAINALTNGTEVADLQIVNLCGSSVSFDSVKNILKKCKNLRALDLTSCRGLPRGMKRKYVNDELDQLREDIDSAKFVQYEDS